MIRADVIELVKEQPAAHGVFDAATETKTAVYASIASVTRAEYYRAKEAGIEPIYVFRLTDYADYSGEKIVIWNEKRFRVVRVYTAGQSIELTVEDATNDR